MGRDGRIRETTRLTTFNHDYQGLETNGTAKLIFTAESHEIGSHACRKVAPAMRIFLPKGNFSLLSYCCSQHYSYIPENTRGQGIVKELAHQRLTVLLPESYFRW